jgi:pimeloyl-ACP methyl ester carboxylesterase
MLMSALVVLSFSFGLVEEDMDGLVPGDGVALDPVPPVVVPVELPESPGGSSGSPVPLGVGGLAAIGVLGAGVAVERRRRRSMEPLLVLVHGNGGSAEGFEPLLEQLSLDTFSVVAFDWRTVSSADTSTDASKVASTEAAAFELDELLRELSVDHGNIYTIHHSKGGAAGVAMIAALDDGTRPMIDGYRGAALLDPAIAGGLLGETQRLGRVSTLIPDNGGFDPLACTSNGCHDRRDHLGEASGVEVIAIRNPDAVITNFWDQPEGMRVFDLVDDGGPSALWFWNVPPLFKARVSQAHGSVLTHWAVADCISAEITAAGGCVWKGDAWRPRIGWGSANSRNKTR